MAYKYVAEMYERSDPEELRNNSWKILDRGLAKQMAEQAVMYQKNGLQPSLEVEEVMFLTPADHSPSFFLSESWIVVMHTRPAALILLGSQSGQGGPALFAYYL